MSQVGVVGGGPVGLILALYLSRYGVASTVYEAAVGPNPTPRGSTHNARTMEHYRVLGLARQADSHGLPEGHSAGISFRDRYNGTLVADVDWPNSPNGGQSWRDDQDVVSLSPERMLRANQCRIEPLLFEAAGKCRDIDLRLGLRVEAVEETDRSVSIALRDTVDGIRHQSEHDFVVGCDGAGSIVRRAAGALLDGSQALPAGVLGAGSTAAHVRIEGLAGQGKDNERRWANWVLNDDAAFNLISLDGQDEYSMLTGHFSLNTASPDQVRALIEEHCVGRVDVDVVDVRRWDGGVALVADRYSTKRLFLAGDAAHLFTPHGGFGMNTGVDDAANLAWKLAAVVRGWAHESLLSTYEEERKPVAVVNTQLARQHGRHLARLPRSGPAMSASFHEYAISTIDTADVAFGSNYVSSSLTTLPSGAKTRAQHFWLSDSERTEGFSVWDQLGGGLSLLYWPRDSSAVQNVLQYAVALGIPLTALPMTDADVRDSYGGDFAIMRPDGHLCWIGDSPDPHTVSNVLLRATGRKSEANL